MTTDEIREMADRQLLPGRAMHSAVHALCDAQDSLDRRVRALEVGVEAVDTREVVPLMRALEGGPVGDLTMAYRYGDDS